MLTTLQMRELRPCGKAEGNSLDFKGPYEKKTVCACWWDMRGARS